MDNFEQEFRDQWNNRQEPEFHEGDWNKLKDRLPGRSSRRLPGWLLWLLPWVGIGGLLYLLLNMHQQLDLLRTNLSSPIAISDTMVQIRELITHDTVYIYHTVIHRDTLFLQAGIGPFAEAETSQRLSLPAATLVGPTDEAKQNDRFLSTSTPSDTQETLREKEWRTLDLLTSSPVEDVYSASSTAIPMPLHYMEVEHIPKVNLVRETLYKMRPDGVELAGEGAGLKPVGNGIRQGTGVSIGLLGALLYGDHWQWGVGVSFNRMSFEIKKFNAALGAPAVEPPSESFDFMAAEVIRPFIALDVQGRYTLSGKNRISPFFEVGLRTIITQPYEVLYDFQDPNTQVTWTYENNPSGEIQLPVQAMLGAGLKYRLGASWSLGLHGQYLHNLSPKNAVPTHVKVGGFIQYSF